MTKLRGWILVPALLWLWACGSPEQSTIDQFFRAAQANDHVTIALMSSVAPPVEVASWQLVEVTSRSKEPFQLPELFEKYKSAESEKDAALETRKKYFEDNEEALARIIPKLREDPEYEFRGRLGEIQDEWERLLEERKEKERVFQELKRGVDDESRLAGKSVVRQVSLENFGGEIAVTEVLLNLTPKESEAELPFKATLKKYDLSDPALDRVEPARWVITSFEGTTPEARAAAESPEEERSPVSESTEVGEPAAVADAPSEQTERREPSRAARELRGTARVQVLTPETKVEGDEAITTIRVRNVSDDWIARFTVTEHWYDDQGSVVSSSSRTHRERFMPGEVIEMVLRTRKDSKFYQNQFEFSHANGDVNAATVKSFPT